MLRTTYFFTFVFAKRSLTLHTYEGNGGFNLVSYFPPTNCIPPLEEYHMTVVTQDESLLFGVEILIQAENKITPYP